MGKTILRHAQVKVKGYTFEFDAYARNSLVWPERGDLYLLPSIIFSFGGLSRKKHSRFLSLQIQFLIIDIHLVARWWCPAKILKEMKEQLEQSSDYYDDLPF